MIKNRDNVQKSFFKTWNPFPFQIIQNKFSLLFGKLLYNEAKGDRDQAGWRTFPKSVHWASKQLSVEFHCGEFLVVEFPTRFLL